MIRRLFGMFIRASQNDRIRFRLLPQAEQARIIYLFEDAKQLNLNSSPESLRAMMRELGRLEALYSLEKAPEIWERAHYHAQNISYCLYRQSDSFKPS